MNKPVHADEHEAPLSPGIITRGRAAAEATSFSYICGQLEAARKNVYGNEPLPIRLRWYIYFAIAGAAWTVAAAIFPALRTVWNSALGLSLELSSFLAFYVAARKAGRLPTSNAHTTMAEYDKLHGHYQSIIQEATQIGPAGLAALIATLDERMANSEAATQWLLGPREKLGLLPVAAALVAQVSIVLKDSSVSAVAVVAFIFVLAISYCVISLTSSAEQARDRRVLWILTNALAIVPEADPSDK